MDGIEGRNIKPNTREYAPDLTPCSLAESIRCVAYVSDGSKRRCRKKRMLGQRICLAHGGGSPQARKSARERLHALVDPAINTLSEVIETGIEAGDMGNAVRASLGVLDRCGFHPTQAVEMTGANGGPIGVVQVDLSHLEGMTTEEKVAMVGLIEKLGIKPVKPSE